MQERGVVGGTPPPALSVVSAMTIGAAGMRQRRIDGAVDTVIVGRSGLLSEVEFAAWPSSGEPVAVRFGVVGDDQNARAGLGHVAIGETRAMETEVNAVRPSA